MIRLAYIRLRFLLTATALSFCLVSPCAAQAQEEPNQLYFTDFVSGGILRAELDGSKVAPVSRGLLAAPRDVAIDAVHRKVYWLEYAESAVRRSDLDGGNVETLLDASDGVQIPTGIALDPEGDALFITTGIGARSILRATLDGQNLRPIITASTQFSELSATSVELDLVQRKIYWAEPIPQTIFRANMDDGSQVETVVTFADNTSIFPYALSLSNVQRRLYVHALYSILSVDLGSGSTQEVAEIPNSSGGDIVVDDVNGRVYWTAVSGEVLGILRSKLDGSDREMIFGGTAESALPFGLAIGPAAPTRTITPATPLTIPPQVVVAGTSATLTLEQFSGASLSRARQAAQILLAATKKPSGKVGFQYEVVVTRLPSRPKPKPDVRKKVSKKNIVTFAKLPSGTYTANYRVQITQKKGGVTRVVGRTKFSPASSFQIGG